VGADKLSLEPLPLPTYQKRFGQHHLVHAGLSRPLVEFLAPRDRTVLEIGPGGGALTRTLLEAGASVVAVEIDPAWAFILRRRLEGARLRLVLADALDLQWQSLPADWLVAGNLPYNVATPLIRGVLEGLQVGARAAFLVQREVGERLTAAPGGRDYGALTVLVAARARAEVLARVKASSFRPPPKVDGLFVGLTVGEPAVPEAQMEAFGRLVQAAFAQRRKTLRNCLGAAWGRERAETALSAAGIDPGQRAERLSLEQFVLLHRGAAR